MDPSYRRVHKDQIRCSAVSVHIEISHRLAIVYEPIFFNRLWRVVIFGEATSPHTITKDRYLTLRSGGSVLPCIFVTENRRRSVTPDVACEIIDPGIDPVTAIVSRPKITCLTRRDYPCSVWFLCLMNVWFYCKRTEPHLCFFAVVGLQSEGPLTIQTAGAGQHRWKDSITVICIHYESFCPGTEMCLADDRL